MHFLPRLELNTMREIRTTVLSVPLTSARVNASGSRGAITRALSLLAMALLAMALLAGLTACRDAAETRVDASGATAAAVPSRSDVPSGVVTASVPQLVLPAPWPTVTADSLGSRDDWHFVYETSPTPRLLVIHRIAALVLPDGPFELLAPVTAVRNLNGVWSQYTPVAGTLPFPAPALRALTAQLTQPDRISFYRIRALDLSTDTTSAHVASVLPTLMREMERDVARLRKVGFIGADAEP